MKRAVCAIALATLGAGCALQPPYQRPPAPVAASYPGAAGVAAQPQRNAADIGWREFLRDARLRRLVELALQNNRDLRAAALNVERVRAEYRIQRAALLPQLQVDASSGVAGGAAASGKGLHASADLAASWEIDFFGRLRNLRDAALEQYLASREAWRAAHILLVSQVASQYLTVRAYDEELAVTEATLTSARESLKIVQLQFDTGAASELQLRQARGVVDLALANRASQQRLRAQAENGLVLLVGQPLPADLPAPLPGDGQPVLADIPAGLPSTLLERRPDILQAEAVLRGAYADIGVARAAWFPRIGLTAALGVASGSLGGLLAGNGSNWSLVPSLAAPLFDGGAARAGVDAARARRDIDVAQYQKTIQTAFREVADGLAARSTYVEQLAAQRRYAADQQRRLELASMLYKNGAAGYLDVLTAQTDAYNARLGVITARLGQLGALVDLYRALGGGWSEDGTAAAYANIQAAPDLPGAP